MKLLFGDLAMNAYNHRKPARRQRGQTIIVAMIILGLLLILGFVFLGIINHSIKTAAFVRDRSVASDLSQAGVRYAHTQLVNSAQGADWRGQPTPPVDWVAGSGPIEVTRDPDALFLRPPATIGGAPVAWPGGGYADHGGPDGLGPFFRVPFSGGRAMVRVIYGPSDADVFRSSPTGALRHPGALRNYIMIESIGREGNVSANDPTRLLSATQRRIGNYASVNDFINELAAMKHDQARLGGLQVNRAFVSIGIIESARFITNKDGVTRPAEIGASDEIGAYNKTAAVTDLPTMMGTALPLLTFDSNNATTAGAVPLGGSLWSNASIELHGRIIANLNQTLGDEIDIAGAIGGDSNAQLVLNVSQWNGGWSTNSTTLGPGQFNSKSTNFDGGNVLRDSAAIPNAEGFPRSIGTKVPPSAFGSDPETRTNRYYEMSRDGGAIVNGVNVGIYGYGPGVYVNNPADLQTPADEVAQANAGGESSLINDWLNPSNPNSKGWRGFLYVPPGAYVQLLTDGFLITRDGRAPQAERTWHMPNGSDTGSATMRYRLGRGTDGKLHIVNTFSVANINGNLGQVDYQSGPEFNGVLYFDGNVRVRGIIPTDVQLTLVSHATIYIEGSLTKGVTGNNYTATYNVSRDSMSPTAEGSRLNRPTKSMLMLIAKDNVAVNTTQFFGAAPSQDVQPQQDIPNLPSYNPILVRMGQALTLRSEFVLDPLTPGATAFNPTQWRSFAGQYAIGNSSGAKISTDLLLIHTQDDGPAAGTFVGMDINAGIGTPTYQFPAGPNPPYANGASAYMAGASLPLYGLGTENYQRFGKFEAITLPLVQPAPLSSENTDTLSSTGPQGTFTLFPQGPNDITLRPQGLSGVSTNDYVLGRLAIAPHDIRIEASSFAENGSFFVIPGPWFNPNPNDNYTAWSAAANGDPDAGNLWRMQTFGASPNIPFYGEPLDVRIVVSGAVSENMPPTSAQQAEWVRKWGWIPKKQGASTTDTIPYQHLSNDPVLAGRDYVPNIILGYDPVLATGRRFGFYDPTSMGGANLNDPGTYVRSRWIDYNMDGIQQVSELVPLPPLPRLPVSPALAYFGEVH